MLYVQPLSLRFRTCTRQRSGVGVGVGVTVGVGVAVGVGGGSTVGVGVAVGVAVPRAKMCGLLTCPMNPLEGVISNSTLVVPSGTATT